MKKIFDKVSKVPIVHSAIIVLSVLTLTLLNIVGTIGLTETALISSVGIVLYMQIVMGKIVFKSVLSGFTILYFTAIYTDMVMNIHGRITEPFMLTVAAVAIFLAQSYSDNRYNYNIRSRPLWSSVLGFFLTTTKMALIATGTSFMITEVIGLNLLVIYIVIWRYWLNNSKRTKIEEPEVVSTEDTEDFRFIYINNKLIYEKQTWDNSDGPNAYPYIYNECLRAEDDGLTLIVVSKSTTSKLFDVGTIDINDSKSLKYLYMEAKEDTYYEDVMYQFIEELGEDNKKGNKSK